MKYEDWIQYEKQRLKNLLEKANSSTLKNSRTREKSKQDGNHSKRPDQRSLPKSDTADDKGKRVSTN